MLNSQEKYNAFEYFVTKLIDWQESGLRNNSNDISILKALKLAFFATVADVDKNNAEMLDDVFDKFYAMPFGHVESDIYDSYKKGASQNVNISATSSSIISEEAKISHNTKIIIDGAIEALKSYNSEIIAMDAMQLVDLSHEYFSWKFYYKEAKQYGSFSAYIPHSAIKGEQKFFSLT